jgi:hypothetical protein
MNCNSSGNTIMISRNQVKQFVQTILDLHRDNFIQLLNNPEFQANDIKDKEMAVEYITALFKNEIEHNLDSFIKTNSN